jgi:hypothetical protein
MVRKWWVVQLFIYLIKHTNSNFCLPDLISYVSQMITHVILRTILWGRHWYYAHFADGQTEVTERFSNLHNTTDLVRAQSRIWIQQFWLQNVFHCLCHLLHVLLVFQCLIFVIIKRIFKSCIFKSAYHLPDTISLKKDIIKELAY